MEGEGDTHPLAPRTSRRVQFGAFVADLGSGELWRDGTPVPLQDLPFRLLAALVERPGDVVSRADLTARLWGPDTFVDAAAGLNTGIAKLREALGDAADRPAFIETLPKRGYRFVAPVEPVASAAPAVTRVEGAVTEAAAEAPPPAAITPAVTQSTRGPMRSALALLALVVTVGAAAAYGPWSAPEPVRVAVVLFDNETDRPALDRFAQALTDATVTSLTAEPGLAVIGNAAVLRTARPFRDVALIRDTLAAHFIVIGQVQARDGGVLVRTHLIRAGDQAHVWIDAFPRGTGSDADFEARVSSQVRGALVAQLGHISG